MNKYLLFLVLVIVTGFSYSQQYHFYRGNLHAHTAYSDGNKEGNALYDTPLESFIKAKEALQFDFMGISEHNHAGAGMKLSDYAMGLSHAQQATDSSFVALYGMEWGTISGGGHVMVYGFDSLIGWDSINGQPNYDIFNAKTDYNGLFEKIAAKNDAFGILAHPEKSDFDSLFHKPLNTINDKAIVGIAYRSGPAFSTDTTYSSVASGTHNARYKDLLKLGYHLSPTIDHDSHYSNFGKATAGRLVVLAEELTASSLTQALKAHRFYASDDWNTEVNFTVNTHHYMGEKVGDTLNPTFTISLIDDNETYDYVRLRYGIPGSGINSAILTSTTSSILNYTHNIELEDTFYYYLEIQQTDGDKIITAPIRYTKQEKNTLINNDSISICQGDSIFLAKNWQLKQGTYADTFQVSATCDSVVITQLTIHPIYFFKDTVTLNFGDSISIAGSYQKEAGIYYDSLQTKFSCDSIIETELVVNIPKANLVITEIMYNPPESGADSLEFIELINVSNQKVDVSGYYFSEGISMTLPSVSLNQEEYLIVCKDSIAMLNTFGVNAFQWSSGSLANTGENIVIKNNQGQTIDSVNYSNSGAWPTLPNGQGNSLVFCDTSLDNSISNNWKASITNTGIFVNGKEIKANPMNSCTVCNSITISTKFYACQGDSLLIHGTYQSKQAIYTDTIEVNGCDSISEVTLNINNTNFQNLFSQICEGDRILIFGNYQTLEGNYIDTLSSANSCDSIVKVNLTVNPVQLSNYSELICEGDSILIGNQYQKQEGVYQRIEQSITGCDSIVNISLFISDDYSTLKLDTILEGDSIFIEGKWQQLSGTYQDSLVSVEGCDSIITTILTVNPVTVTGISQQLDERITVFPNPFENNFTIINSDFPTSGKIINLLGEVVQEFKIKKGITQVKFLKESNGIYFLVIDLNVMKLVKK